MPLCDRCQNVITPISGTGPSNDQTIAKPSTSASQPKGNRNTQHSSNSHFSLEIPATSTNYATKDLTPQYRLPPQPEPAPTGPLPLPPAFGYEPFLSHEPGIGRAAESDEDSLDGMELPFAENPRNWSTKTRCLIAAFVLLSAFTATLGTPIYVAAIPAIAARFHPLSTTLAILPAAMYALSLGISALLSTSFSEIYGRMPILRVTLPLSLLFTILASTAPTYAYLVVSKTLSGLFSGPCLTVGVGIINDMWNIAMDKLGGRVAVLFVCCSVWAAVVGPMISAVLMKSRPGEWAWTFHFCSFLLVPLVVVAWMVPETYIPSIKRKLAKKKGYRLMERDPWPLLRKSVGRPLHMLLVEPVVFPTGLIMALTQSVVFAYYVAYAILFETTYSFSQYQVGMAFAPLLVGSLLALPVMAWLEKYKYEPAKAKALKRGEDVEPEWRLIPAMIGGFLLPLSLFWLAFSGKKGIHWIVPVLSGVPFGLSYVLNMLSVPMYTNDIYKHQFGASVLAASTFMRFATSSSFLLFTNHVVDKLGFRWAVAGMGFVTVLLIPVPWVFWKVGPSLRARSVYLKRM